MTVSKEEGNALLDFYEELLTDKQKDVLNLYFKEDLSLSKIAEDLAISKSAVSDLLNRSIHQLQNYEAKLSLVENYRNRLKIYHRLEQMENPEVTELVQKLINLE
ncbi:MAG: DNA-binding protein [Erysipelotrichaceae bacterium]|nr:DNA-binding protein [Erysipelotrichaceae bacterium]